MPDHEEKLEEIKKLFILQLYKSDVSTKEIGRVLGVSYKTIERVLSPPVKKAKRKK